MEPAQLSSFYANGHSLSPPQAGKQQHLHRPLRLFMVARAIVVLSILLCSASVMLICLAPLAFFLLRLVSIHHSRRLVSFLFGHWLAMWPYFFEKVNRTRVSFSGDHVPAGERVLLMCNHRTEVDWMYIWSLALRKQRIGHVKYVLKSSVRNVPVFGWAFYALEFLLIKRNWQHDESVFASCLSTFKDSHDPLWLIIFPEGTDYTDEKCMKSQKFAEKHSLPKLSHVLLPRTKGFCACLAELHESIDAVYDLTIGYKDRYPLFMDNAFGTDPKEVHIHVKRTPISDIPLTESEASSWLIKEFSGKDELLSYFYKEGTFPGTEVEGSLSIRTGITKFCIILFFTFGLIWFMSLSSLWIKVYIAASCACLTAATFFDYKPQPLGIMMPFS